MYLLDTNVVSEARRRSPQAVAWLRSVHPETLYLSVIAIGEIVKGIAVLARRDAPAAQHLTRWLDEMRQTYASRLLPVDEAVATHWGRLMGQRTWPVADALIAATALAHNKVLVTRNVGDFVGAGLTIVDPWQTN
jgi:predicted nucleic acid-binding protein